MISIHECEFLRSEEVSLKAGNTIKFKILILEKLRFNKKCDS